MFSFHRIMEEDSDVYEFELSWRMLFMFDCKSNKQALRGSYQCFRGLHLESFTWWIMNAIVWKSPLSSSNFTYTTSSLWITLVHGTVLIGDPDAIPIPLYVYMYNLSSHLDAWTHVLLPLYATITPHPYQTIYRAVITLTGVININTDLFIPTSYCIYVPAPSSLNSYNTNISSPSLHHLKLRVVIRQNTTFIFSSIYIYNLFSQL